MRCKILIYLIIIAGFITSCTRDSTELNIDEETNIEKITSEGEEIEIKFGFNPTGDLSVIKEPLGAKTKTDNDNLDEELTITELPTSDEPTGAGTVSIDNGNFDDFNLMLRLQKVEGNNKEFIAGGYYRIGEIKSDLNKLSAKLIAGKEYILDVQLVKLFYIVSDVNDYLEDINGNSGYLSHISYWTDPKKRKKLINIENPYRYSKTYIASKKFTAGNSSIDINLKLKSVGFKMNIANLSRSVDGIEVVGKDVNGKQTSTYLIDGDYGVNFERNDILWTCVESNEMTCDGGIKIWKRYDYDKYVARNSYNKVILEYGKIYELRADFGPQIKSRQAFKTDFLDKCKYDPNRDVSANNRVLVQFENGFQNMVNNYNELSEDLRVTAYIEEDDYLIPERYGDGTIQFEIPVRSSNNRPIDFYIVDEYYYKRDIFNEIQENALAHIQVYVSCYKLNYRYYCYFYIDDRY